MVKAHTISSASRYDHARDREGRRKRSAALRLRPERQPAGSPFPGRRRWEPRELRVRRRQGSRMRIALPGTYSTRRETIRFGLRRESRDDCREASVETIERNLFISFAGALFCKCYKGIKRGLGPGEQRSADSDG